MDRRSIRNPEVLSALEAIDSTADIDESVARGRVLYRALRDSTVFVPAERLGETGAGLRLYFTPDGRRIVTAYTSHDLAPADSNSVILPFAKLCQSIASLGLAVHINPGRPPSGIAPSNWVRAIAEGCAEMPNPVTVAATSISGDRVAAAHDVRGPIKARLTQALSSTSEVREAYLVQQDEVAGLVVGLVLESSDVPQSRHRSLSMELYAWVAPFMLETEEIYFQVVGPKSSSVALFKATGPPFYRRSS